MNETGYILRTEYVALAVAKLAATSNTSGAPEMVALQSRQLNALADAVVAVDALECSLPQRLAAARSASRSDSKAPETELSEAAQEAIGASVAVDLEYHRLLARRCRRAGTAAEVVGELIESAGQDLELTEWLHRGSGDTVAEPLVRELVDAKRRVVWILEGFVSAGDAHS